MDKLEILLDMTEHPDRYTEEQMQELLADEDVHKHYQMMVWLRESTDGERSSSPLEEVLAEESVPSGRTRRRLWKIAAAFVGAVLMAGLLFAVVRPFMNSSEEVEKLPPSREGGGRVLEGLQEGAVVFQDAPLDSILTVVARHYGKVVQFRNEEVRTMRLIMTWQPTDSLASLIGRLNLFEGLQLTLQADTLIVEIEKKEAE